MTVPFDVRDRRRPVRDARPRTTRRTDALRPGRRRPTPNRAVAHRAPAREPASTIRAAVRPDTTWWSPHAIGLAVVISIVVAVGLVFVASSSSVTSLNRYGSSWHIFQRQLQWVGLGVVFLGVAIVVPYRTWNRLAPWLFGLTWLATLATLVVGISRNGSRRWIGPESVALQPSEALKFAMTIGLASLFLAVADKPDRDRLLSHQVVVAAVMCLGPVALQPDMGTGMVLLAILCAMALYVGLSGRRFAKIGGIAAVLIGLFAWHEPYRRDRLLAFRHPERDLDGIGYHVMQSKLGFASGRLFGVGVGASKAKWGFLPNSHTDFIFAIIGEELGLVGAGLVLFLFLFLAVLGMQTARRAPDRFGALVAVGITAWLFSQAIINMGAVVGALPVTGVPLPLISVGGSSFVVVMGALGVLLNIARSGRRPTAQRAASGRPATERAASRRSPRDRR
jgi:cell division protein FtsW